MITLNFINWLESADKEALKSMILNFLKDKLNLRDDSDILFMKVKSINSSIINNLFSRGLIQNVDENLKKELISSDLTISDLIERLSDGIR